jgi:hypothetical protein
MNPPSCIITPLKFSHPSKLIATAISAYPSAIGILHQTSRRDSAGW